MRQLAKSEILCRDAKDLPTQVVDKLHQDFVQKLGKPVSTQFPAFANAFPRTTETMEVNFTPLALIYRQRDSGDYGIRGQYDGEKTNLVFRPQPIFYPPDDPGFDQSHQMLPPRWRELYRYFDSIGIQSDKSVGRLSIGLPTAYSGKMSEERYEDIISIFIPGKTTDKKALADFCLRIGNKHPYPNGRGGDLRCWCLSYSGDSLWISNPDTDHNVYCVVDGDFNNEILLDDPGSVLDNYMATAVTSPAEARFIDS